MGEDEGICYGKSYEDSGVPARVQPHLGTVSGLPSTSPSSQSLITQAGELAQPCPAQGIPKWETDPDTTLQMHKAGVLGSMKRDMSVLMIKT